MQFRWFCSSGLCSLGDINNCRNSPIFYESERNIYFYAYLYPAKTEVDIQRIPDLTEWLGKFDENKIEGAREFWYQTLMGIDESLREFF